MKNIYAYTGPTPKFGYVGYISVNQRDGGIEFTVRSEGENAPTGAITLSPEQCEHLATDLLAHINQEPAAQPPHLQPQAQGEPEVVAWAMPRSDGLVLDVICPDEHEAHAGDYTIPLITLQSHREALAQHRAALEECVEALEELRNEVRDSNTFDQPGAFVCCDMPCDGAHSDNCKASAAITNANQVLGGGGK